MLVAAAIPGTPIPLPGPILDSNSPATQSKLGSTGGMS